VRRAYLAAGLRAQDERLDGEWALLQVGR